MFTQGPTFFQPFGFAPAFGFAPVPLRDDLDAYPTRHYSLNNTPTTQAKTAAKC
jgi:hypothetical protein